MSERSERHVPTTIANGREATEARRARGSTLGGFLLEGAIVPATLPGASIWLRRENSS
jgi:hypothetical protein